MRLTFPRERILRLIQHSEANPEVTPLFHEQGGGYEDYKGSEDDDEEAPIPEPKSLVIVGDHGIYICSRSRNMLLDDETTHGPEDGDYPKGRSKYIAYANECNPDEMEFEDCWDVKQRSFGGDDGVDAIPWSWIEQWRERCRDSGDLVLDLEPNGSMALIIPADVGGHLDLLRKAFHTAKKRLGLTDDMLGAKMQVRGVECTIVGCKPRARKFHVVLQKGPGSFLRVDAKDVVQHFRLKKLLNLEAG